MSDWTRREVLAKELDDDEAHEIAEEYRDEYDDVRTESRRGGTAVVAYLTEHDERARGEYYLTRRFGPFRSERLMKLHGRTVGNPELMFVVGTLIGVASAFRTPDWWFVPVMAAWVMFGTMSFWMEADDD